MGRICAEWGGKQKPESLMWFFSLTLMLSESGRTKTTLDGGHPGIPDTSAAARQDCHSHQSFLCLWKRVF